MNGKALCDLCGLALPARPWTLTTAQASLRFCCEGCEGIYRMLNNIPDDPAPTDSAPPTTGDDPWTTPR